MYRNYLGMTLTLWSIVNTIFGSWKLHCHLCYLKGMRFGPHWPLQLGCCFDDLVVGRPCCSRIEGLLLLVQLCHWRSRLLYRTFVCSMCLGQGSCKILRSYTCFVWSSIFGPLFGGCWMVFLWRRLDMPFCEHLGSFFCRLHVVCRVLCVVLYRRGSVRWLVQISLVGWQRMVWVACCFCRARRWFVLQWEWFVRFCQCVMIGFRYLFETCSSLQKWVT